MPGEGDRPRLKRVRIEGFRSIASAEIAFTDLDVLIGANGAGKSNLIAFLRMVGLMLSSDGGLSLFVGRAGGASALLHDGPKVTRVIKAEIAIETATGLNEYAFSLEAAAGDALIFAEEKIRFSRHDLGEGQSWLDFGVGHRTPGLIHLSDDQGKKTQRTILHLLRGLSVFQFHDTSPEAPLKRKWRVGDGRYLRGDGGNLAAFLLHMRETAPLYHRRVVKTIQLVAPFFDDFAIEDDEGYALLQWREVGSDMVFGPGQISDGLLRAVALIALLLQPPATLPSILVVDEPELGLHPAGLQIVIGLFKAATSARQCIVATQSPELLRALAPEDVIVVDRSGRSSTFRRLNPVDLDRWLDDYGLDELWDMNLLGGRPGSLAAE
jgi:predicted ATPase